MLFRSGHNPDFERTLKKNASDDYCRSYIYENALMLYRPELRILSDAVRENLRSGKREALVITGKMQEERNVIMQKYFSTPLEGLFSSTQKLFANDKAF